MSGVVSVMAALCWRAVPRIVFAVCLGVVVAGCETVQLPPVATRRADVKEQKVLPVVPEPLLQSAPKQSATPGGVVPKTPIEVALLLPLSGAAADVGGAMLEAAELGWFDQPGPGVILRPYDTKGDPVVAAAAARRAVTDGVSLILGPLYGQTTHSVALNSADTPVISFTSDPSAASPGVFTIGFLLRDQAQALVAHAIAEGLQRFAIVAPGTAFGRSMSQAFKDAVEQAGGVLTAVRLVGDQDALENVVRDVADYDRRARALKRRQVENQRRAEHDVQEPVATLDPPPYDAVFVAYTGSQLTRVVAALRRYDGLGDQVRMMGPMSWAGEAARSGDATIMGAWYPALSLTAYTVFDKRYRKLYGAAASPTPLAALAYDAATLAMVLARDSGARRPYPTEVLTDPSGFAGACGLFRLRGDGLSERTLTIMEMRRGGPVVVAPALSIFPLTPQFDTTVPGAEGADGVPPG